MSRRQKDKRKRPLSIKFDNGLFYVQFIFLIVPPDNLCSVISGPAPDRGRCKKFCPLPPVQGEVFVDPSYISPTSERIAASFLGAFSSSPSRVQQLDAFMFFRKGKEMDNGPGTEGRMIGDWLDVLYF